MKKDFNILIVEDELMIAEMAKAMLLDLNFTVIATEKTYNEAIVCISEAKNLDLVILDINLEEQKSGIDIGMEIMENYKIPFIYLTSYSDPSTFQKAALTSPAAYLLKPFSKSDLYTTIELIKARKFHNNHSVMLKDGDLNVKIDSRDITYIKSDNNYIEIYTVKKKYVERMSIEKFLDTLSDSNFIRIHRSYVVNITKVEAINGHYAHVGGNKCPISRSHKEEVLSNFLG